MHDANEAHRSGGELPLHGRPIEIPANDTTNGDDGDWPRPEPLGRDAKPVPFPTEVLPAWVRDFVEAEAASTQAPLDMAAVFAIGALAAALGGYVRVQAWSGFVEACNLYVAVALPPSELKSPTHRHVCAPLEQLEKKLRAEAEPKIRDAETQRELLEKRLKRAMDSASKAKLMERDSAEAQAKQARQELDAAEVPAVPRLLVDDCTLEVLKTLLAEQGGRLAMLSAESAFFGNVATKRYSDNPNIEAALAGHSGDTLRVDRRGRSEIIEDPRLTICVAVQPTVLTEAARSEAAKGRGLFARFLYSLPTPCVGFRDLSQIPPAVPEPIMDAWHRHVLTLATMVRTPDKPVQLHSATRPANASNSGARRWSPTYAPADAWRRWKAGAGSSTGTFYGSPGSCTSLMGSRPTACSARSGSML